MNMMFASLLPPELFKFVNTRHVTSFLKMSGEGEGRSTQEFLKSKIKKRKKRTYPNIQEYPYLWDLQCYRVGGRGGGQPPPGPLVLCS